MLREYGVASDRYGCSKISRGLGQTLGRMTVDMLDRQLDYLLFLLYLGGLCE